jgi:peptide/nickel transport system substrate-binding protein
VFNRSCLQGGAALATMVLLAGCGLFAESGDEEKKRITVGTMSEPTSLDPAAAWDGSWELFRNVYQTLLSFPAGGNIPQPDAAKVCGFTDTANTVYECELRPGLIFTNGEKLDSAAVKHSLERIRLIGARSGPKGLFGSLDRIDTSGDRLVRFTLKSPDATFPYVLATPAASLVPPGEYPAGALRRREGLVGSGPYTLGTYRKGDRAELRSNGGYRGFAERKNSAVTIRYFRDSEAMVTALRNREIDATYRGLTADDIGLLQRGLPENRHLRLLETVGADIRYLVFNPRHPVAARHSVRKAVAHLVDRGSLVATVYRSTAEPLYSMVPKGIAGHTTEFFDRYGEPDAAKAREVLEADGIDEPVALDLWYTTDRYGSATAAEFNELKRQLEGSGLFRVTVRGRPWSEFQKGYHSGAYPVFGRGWFPDYPDADNFIAPFVGADNVLGTPYESPRITDELLPASRRESDRAAVVRQFEEAQEILAEDVRLLPLWQGKIHLATSEELGGAERALDPQTVMQMWELYRKASW